MVVQCFELKFRLDLEWGVEILWIKFPRLGENIN